jgi:hypothetical protein
MTIKEYVEATGTPITTVQTWLENGLPHKPARQIQVDFDKVELWKETKLRPRGRPRKPVTLEGIAV